MSQTEEKKPPHVAKLLASHVHAITQLQVGECSNFSLGDMRTDVERFRESEYIVGGRNVGNLFGALERYMELALTESHEVIPTSDV